MSQVKSMKKVSISVCLKAGLATGGSPAGVDPFIFIYGIGRDGLSPFECCLEGAHVGESILFEVKRGDLAEYFSGLFPKIRPLVDGGVMPKKVFFEVEVKGVEEVDNREVVAALANSASGCGSGGSCGCGCS
ncbi:MAG: hypothetical protein ACI8ZB_001315 [Desulforhopalus sp.]